MTRLIAFAGLAETRWANGAGRKADIAEGAGWALSFAWLDGPAAFSDYSGRERSIILVEGDGFVLEGEGRSLTVDRPHVPARFDGGWKTACRLLGGPCLVLNAWSLRGQCQHRMRVVEPRGAGPLAAGDFMVVLAGQVWLAGVAGGPRDTLRAEAPSAASGSGDARVALIRFG